MLRGIFGLWEVASIAETWARRATPHCPSYRGDWRPDPKTSQPQPSRGPDSPIHRFVRQRQPTTEVELAVAVRTAG